MPPHASSKPSMSQKRMLTSHFATPMVASRPLLKSRCTTQGGTYIDHDRMVLRMDKRASCSTWISLTAAVGSGNGASSSLSAVSISRDDIAIMSSASDRRGLTSRAVNFWILTFSTSTKQVSSTTMATIVSTEKSVPSRACTFWSSSAMLEIAPPPPQVALPGKQACSTSDALRPMPLISVSALANGSSSEAGTPAGRHWPPSKYVLPSRKRSSTSCRRLKVAIWLQR
mmetsp:Transcript_22378/g.63500  ORF Transcript_22378/g.63500 Transcript_22378/m.63500 type:complete len:228 (+) Transcript_22378:1079-1762(+)